MAFTKKYSITIDKTKCGTADSTDFPMLFAGTYAGGANTPDLRTTANGGNVTNANGYDICFYSDEACTTMLKFERVFWTASTGACQFYVKIPTLTYATNTVIYLGVGDASIETDQQDANNTWGSNFVAGYHLEGNSNDTTGGGFNGSDTGIAYGTNYGKYGQGAQFESANLDKIDLGTSSNLSPSEMSVFAWANGDTFPNAYNAIIGKETTSHYWMLSVNSSGKLCVFVRNVDLADIYYTNGSHTLSTDTWYRVAFTYKAGTGLTGYVNGNSDKNVSNAKALDVFTATCLIGNQPGYTRYWNGWVDELWVMSASVTPSWITADYNNQSSPSTFYALAEVSAATGTNFKINIGDSWKTVSGIKINVGDSWKTVTKAQINIGDSWKTIFGS
jgi:hypothetical protein